MIKPMPKALLIHTAQYEEYEGKGRYGDEFKGPIALTNILIQPVSNIKRNNIGDSVGYNSLMFFDCINSRPKHINFTEKSKITFNGQEMIINKINPIYAFNLHHYELELI